MRSEIIEHTGRIHNQFEHNGGLLINAEMGRFFLASRSPTLSDSQAIRIVSKYGISPVVWVGESSILERYVEFVPLPLSLKDMANLLKEMHTNKNEKGTLIHGDFSRHNTTIYEGKPLCFDYEYSSWENAYIDLGRVVLRECKSQKEVESFFIEYCGFIPSSDDLREGFISFCNRQYKMRSEKNLEFREVPLKRAERLKICNSKLDDLLYAFKAPIKNDK